MTIASEITRLQNDKAAICTAIENKWVTVWNVKLDDYAACIDAISTWGQTSKVDFLLIWWGGAWSWVWCVSTYWRWWGGWAWWYIECKWYEVWCWLCYCVVVWSWWAWKYNWKWSDWWDSCFWMLVAYWWWAWWNSTSNWNSWWSWWWAWRADSWSCPGTPSAWGGLWCCWQWHNWWWSWTCNQRAWWWGWAWWEWSWNWVWYDFKWWIWKCSDITWECVRYAWWWAWYWGWQCWCTWCWAGGSGVWRNSTSCNWKNWIFVVRYHTDGSDGISCATGWTKYTCWYYTIHCFTSNWFFCICDAVSPWYITTPWIYHSPSLWLISMSRDGTTRYTLQDKNLWATSYNVSSTDSYWCMYQWWNNNPFPSTWCVTNRTTTKVDTTGYWPWNYYCRDCFVYDSSSCNCDWSNPSNDNLRWNTTNTYIARQWPSPDWYHVPTSSDILNMINTMKCIKWWDLTADDVIKFLCMPKAWYRSYNNGCTITCGWACFTLRTSSINTSWQYPNWMVYTQTWPNSNWYYNRRWTWLPIRAFKNTACVPTLDMRYPIIKK